MKIVVRVLLPRAVPGDRAHACWRRGSGSLTRPSTAGLQPTPGAISTTHRRATIRPCNLSREVTQPASLRCALRCSWDPPHFRSRGWPAAGHGVSSVDHRIAMTVGAIPTTDRRPIHPAWESISRRSPARAAALRVAVARKDRFDRPTDRFREDPPALAHFRPRG